MKNWPRLSGSPQDRALAHVAALSWGRPLGAPVRVTLNFHPDWIYGEVSTLQALAMDGVYRCQFETGTSNGGLTAYPGGNRWLWESRIFGGAYDEMPPVERPKYGALNYKGRATGAASRFGSAHLRLRQEALTRCTFCYPDSVFEPTHFGVWNKMGLITHMLNDDRDLLDDYIEAHIHGPIRLADDVEALVLDPCYRGTEVEDQAYRLPCAIEWHPGFRLPAETLRRNPHYRGRKHADLGLRLAHSDHLDPATLGKAACSGEHDAQDLKKVWHYIARYGDRSLSSY